MDGNVWTSAGVTAGIDLALAMVEDDLGANIAQTVAQWLVVFLGRPGGQSQFAPSVWAPPARSEPIRAAQDLIDMSPNEVGPIAQLARSVGLSPRHFTRRFKAETGQNPGAYVEQTRVAAPRHHLASSEQSMGTVAAACGFGSAETLRRAFHRQLGVSPDSYRKRFTTTSQKV